MTTEVTTTQNAAPGDGGAPLGAVPPAEPQQQVQQPPAAVPPVQNDPNKVLSIPTAAMKRIKDEERERGRREALADLASRSGFESDIDLVHALSTLKNQPAGQQTAPQPPPAQQTQPQGQQPPAQQPAVDPQLTERNNQRAAAKYERDLERLTRQVNDLSTKYTTTQAEAKRLKDQLDAKDAEMALREIAVAAGVTDVDYALRLYYRDVEGKSEEELKQLDERTYFTGLRATKPYLFNEVVKPANTGPGAGGAPTAPKPGQVTTTTANNGSFDGRKASPKEVEERLRRMGLNSHL